MLDLITRAVQPFVKIRKEEWSKTLLMFFYFFITITCLYILKPVRSAIFLEKSGFENLPYVWITTILVLMGIVAVYVKLVSWLQKNVLLMGTIFFFMSNILTFWWLFGKEIPGLPFAFYIWVSIFSIMTVTQFWTLANDIFNSREAKRLFGFIGSGGILGGMAGGYITGLMVHTLGTINLLFVAFFILFFSAIAVHVIWQREQKHHETKLHHDESDEIVFEGKRISQNRELFKNIWRSKYLLLLLTMVCFAKLVSTLVEYQFNGIVQSSFIGIDQKTAFFGWFWGTLNTVSFLIQFFLTSRVLRHLGVKAALLILPVGLLLGNTAILLHPGLWSAMFTMMYDGSLNYSLNQAAKEVLYLPISREIRYRVKPFIDMVGYRTAKAMGSLLILFLVQILAIRLDKLSYVTVSLIVVWILAALVMKKEYLEALRKLLAKEKSGITQISIQSSDVYLLNTVIDTLVHGTGPKQLAAVQALNLVHHPTLNAYLKDFPQYSIEDAREEIRSFFHDGHALPHEMIGKRFLEELKAVLKRSGLETFQEHVRFVTSSQDSRDISELRIFLASSTPEVQRAAFLLLVLFDPEFDYEKLPENFKRNLKTEDGLLQQLNLKKTNFFITQSAENEKTSQIQKKLADYLAAEDGEKAFGLLEEFIRDEEEFLGVVDQFLNQEYLSESASSKLVRILGMIPRQQSVHILEKSLKKIDGELKNSILEALSKIRIENPELVFNEEGIIQEIHSEVKEYRKVLQLVSLYLWYTKKTFNGSLSDQDSFLFAQECRLNEMVQRIFLLLVLLSEPEDIRMVYRGFSHESDYVRANALELLDNLLESKLRRPILALLDGDDSLPRIREKGIKDVHWSEATAAQFLKNCILSKISWTGMSAAALLARCQLKGVLEECRSLAKYPNPLVRETLDLVQTVMSERPAGQ